MHEANGKRILLLEPRGNIPFLVLPLALGMLKSNIPDHHEVKVFDCSLHDVGPDTPRFRELLLGFKPDVVGISSSMQTIQEGLGLAKAAKAIDPGITTALGGSHPSIFPAKVLENAFVDVVFRGECELTFPVFLDVLETPGKYSEVLGLVYRHNGNIIENDLAIDAELDKRKFPDYEAINLEDYIQNGYNYGGHYGRTAPIWITRGCPHACSFCSASLINGIKIRRHSVDYIVKWINRLYHDHGIRQFAVIDDNFTFKVAYVKEFCRTIIQLRDSKHFKEKIYFVSPNGIRLDRIDSEMLQLMKQAGWNDLTVAPESGSLKTLKRMRKTIKPSTVSDAVDTIKKAGLDVRGNFIIGFPGETWDDINDTVKLIRSCRFDFFNINLFYPIPGSYIFDELVRDGEIPPDYQPEEIYKRISEFGAKKDDQYIPKDLKNLNAFTLYMRELIYLAFRNPHAIIFFVKYYGIKNVVKKLLFLWKS